MGGKLPGPKRMEFNGYELDLLDRALRHEIRHLQERMDESARPERVRPLLEAYEKLRMRFMIG